VLAGICVLNWLTKISAVEVWWGGGGFDILALGLKLASYDSEEKHGLLTTDFHETRT
jgi:hypothetical protein